MTLPAPIVRVLVHRRLPVLLAGLATLLSLPALWVGFQIDDWFHRVLLLDLPAEVLPQAMRTHGLFAFIDGDPEHLRVLKDIGLLPWWAPVGLRASFWRPVTELTHRLDYWLWPDTPALMHLQSLVWAAAVVAAAAWLYRRLMGVTVAAGLAAFFYAVDQTHGIPIGWIANRNALIATFFGLGALIAHDRWRRDGWRAGAFLAPAIFVVGLFAAEAAIATTAYLFAYALFLDRARGYRKLLPLVPYGALVMAWRLAYDRLGFGAWGSGLYIDPGRELARFVPALLQRAPVLLAGQWGPVPSDLDVALPDVYRPAVALGLAVLLAGVGVIFAPLVRRDPLARFFALGMALSLLPISATFPSDRLLLFVGLGAMGLIARFVSPPPARETTPGGVPPPSPGARPRAERALAVALAGIHGVLCPLLLPLRTYSPRLMGAVMQPCVESAPSDEAVAGQDLVIVNGVDFCASYIPVLALAQGRVVPAHVRNLSSGISPVTVVRPDVRTLVLRREGGFFTVPAEQLFCSPRHPWKIGDRVELGKNVTIEVTALTPDGRPLEITSRFTTPLEDRTLRWYELKGRVLAPFTLPRPGDPPVTLPGLKLF